MNKKKEEDLVTIELEGFTPEQELVFNAVVHEGELRERERVLALWEAEMVCPCEEPMQHLASRIKGEI
jgi:hypothetical protein